MKLRQTGLLRDYILEFCRLANHTRDISPALLKSCFIGQLKPELRHDVKILKPETVLDATAYAQQVDAKLSKLKVRSLSILPAPSKLNRQNPFQNITNTTPPESKPKVKNVRKLTPEEVEFCRKNGLCFHCKEKYVRGHSCEKK